jgi:hypothetical protein
MPTMCRFFKSTCEDVVSHAWSITQETDVAYFGSVVIIDNIALPADPVVKTMAGQAHSCMHR